MLFRNKRYLETLPTEHELGTAFPDYRPTYRTRTARINENHALYDACATQGELIDIGIEGWLRRADALKLYELAYRARGDILELGFYHGLATSVLSQANHDSGLSKDVFSLEVWCEHVETAHSHLRARAIADRVHLICEDAVGYIDRAAADSRSFSLVFVDHSHAYQDVYDVCVRLETVVRRGGFCLFHDFNDARNTGPAADYGVYHAVRDGLAASFRFYGVFGCAALYKRARWPL